MNNGTAEILLEALPYMREFRDEIFVIKIGGELVDNQDYLDSIAKSVSFLSYCEIKPIIVHGGKKQVDELLKKLWDKKSKRINGVRVTETEELEAAKMVYGGKTNIEVANMLRKYGAKAVGISGADGIIQAKQNEEYGYVGIIENVDTSLLNHLLSGKFLPVMSCLIESNDGQILNCNADTVAQKIAESMKAKKLIMLTHIDGVLRKKNDLSSLIPHLTISEAELLIEEKIVDSEMIPKCEACVGAVKGGIEKAHIINGTKPYSLLTEIFTKKGVGTVIELQ